MAGEGERQVVGVDAAAVIDDADQLGAALLEVDLDARGCRRRSEFSSSSLTTLAGRSMTSPAAILVTTRRRQLLNAGHTFRDSRCRRPEQCRAAIEVVAMSALGGLHCELRPPENPSMLRSRLFVVAAALATSAATLPAEPPKAARDYRGLMREFVQGISKAAKQARPGFLVVPQGGVELLTDDGEPDGTPVADYLKAIDGFGQEEIYYGYDNKDDRKTPKKETEHFVGLLGVARKAGKPVLSIDYATTREKIDDAYARNAAAGFIPFVADRRGLDSIPAIPRSRPTSIPPT